MCVRFPLSLRDVEDLLHGRGIEIGREMVHLRRNRFGPIFSAEIRRQRVDRMRAFSNWRWRVDDVFVKISGERHYLRRAVDHRGEALEAFVAKRRNKKAALKFLMKLMRRHGSPSEMVTARYPSYRAPPRELGAFRLQTMGRWLNNRVANTRLPLDDGSGRCFVSG